jgi:nucleoside 2-deoxyribosyltransferase
MRVYISLQFHADQRNRPWIEEISTMLTEMGHETFCPARDIQDWGGVRPSPAEFMQRVFTEIAASDVLLIDLTEKGVGIGIEAGFAHTRKIPIFTVAQSGCDISRTLQGISDKIYWYASPVDLRRFFDQVFSM